MDSPEARFDRQMAAAGAAIELAANASAFAHHLLYEAETAADEAAISPADPRTRGLKELLETWSDAIAPAFANATQKDPTGARAAAVQRPWSDPRLVGAGI